METEANLVREQRLSLRDQRLSLQRATERATWLGAIRRCSHVQRLRQRQGASPDWIDEVNPLRDHHLSS
jgi:hypothetical protein